jgi:hypothetical protein
MTSRDGRRKVVSGKRIKISPKSTVHLPYALLLIIMGQGRGLL